MKIRRPIFIMSALFGASVMGGAYFFRGIVDTWHHNPIANTAILFLMVVGLLYTLYAIVGLWRAQRQWLVLEKDCSTWRDDTQLLGALKFFSGRLVNELLSDDAHRREEIIDSFETSLALRARLAEYLGGLLIGLGLLGTFIGLMETMGSIGDVLKSLNGEGGGGAQAMLESLSAPLSGMSSAFSASLMGLLGSLLMGAIAQFMSDANDNLVQRIRTWSQRSEAESTGSALAVIGVGAMEGTGGALVERIWLPKIHNALKSLYEGQERRYDTLRVGLDGLAAIAKDQVELQRRLCADSDVIRSLLVDANYHSSALGEAARLMLAAGAATRRSLDGIASGMASVVGAQNENRVAVNGAVQSLADTLANMSANGVSSNRKLDAIEAALVDEVANLKCMTQSVVAQQEALLELVRHVSSIATQGSMLRVESEVA